MLQFNVCSLSLNELTAASYDASWMVLLLKSRRPSPPAGAALKRHCEHLLSVPKAMCVCCMVASPVGCYFLLLFERLALVAWKFALLSG
jgi:hypothetical protein